ncbi:hypothetical protein ACWV26_18645 [Rummeliibacillus sp. JY-2-4R]
MMLQHKLAFEQGHQKILTIGRNYRKGMLILNIKAGFDIIETYISNSGKRKIIMEKEL